MIPDTNNYESRQNRNAMAGDTSGDVDDTDWFGLARNANRLSTTFIDANLKNRWENALRQFQSKHPAGSKYGSTDYKSRSRLFRPKTRAAVRRSEASAAAAFFSTLDVVSISAENDGDEQQHLSAVLLNELLNYRLTRSVKWFLSVSGAVQDSNIYGVVTSKQYWRFERRLVKQEFQPHVDADTGEMQTDETGNILGDQVSTYEVICDKPVVELLPPERVKIDPAADWMDPINSSPYLIIDTPMYVVDVKARMAVIDGKTGQEPWTTYDDSDIAKARLPMTNSTQSVRDGRSYTNEEAPDRDYQQVMVHEVFMNRGGTDYVYWVLGEVGLLTQPVELKEVYFQGVRPVVMGFATIEAHRTYPVSKVEEVAPLQREMNDLVNRRQDNLALAINARYFVKRGRSVDIQSLMRSTSGGVTLMDDPAGDVNVVRAPDVTSGAYEEQDRLNVDFDDLSGSFSAGSVASNRQLNETVGGLQILSAGSNGLQDFSLRVFVESWAEPVLRQLVLLEQAYETDETILAIAGQKAGVFKRWGIDKITDDMILSEVDVRVNVGLGATDPGQKLQKFMAAMGAIAQLFGPAAQHMINPQEIITEVMAGAGYRDGDRFFNLNGDPRITMLMQQLQQMQQQITLLQSGQAAKIQIAREGNVNKLQVEQLKGEAEMASAAFRAGLDLDANKLDFIQQTISETQAFLRDLTLQTVPSGITPTPGAAPPIGGPGPAMPPRPGPPMAPQPQGPAPGMQPPGGQMPPPQARPWPFQGAAA